MADDYSSPQTHQHWALMIEHTNFIKHTLFTYLVWVANLSIHILKEPWCWPLKCVIERRFCWTHGLHALAVDKLAARTSNAWEIWRDWMAILCVTCIFKNCIQSQISSKSSSGSCWGQIACWNAAAEYCSWHIRMVTLVGKLSAVSESHPACPKIMLSAVAYLPSWACNCESLRIALETVEKNLSMKQHKFVHTFFVHEFADSMTIRLTMLVQQY